MKTFQTENFTLQVPAGWEHRQDGGTNYNVMFINTSADKYSYNLTLKRVVPLVNGGNPTDAPGMVEKMYEGMITPNDTILAVDGKPVGNLQARRLKLQRRFTQNGQTLEVVQTYLMLMDPAKNVGYQIVTSALPGQQAETDPVFEQIVQSFRQK